MTTVESVERASKWLIVSDGCDGHYIDIFCSWKEALLEHIKWLNGSVDADEEMYRTALSGFNDRDKAIKFFNTIIDDTIIFMAELNGEEFVNRTYFE